MNDLIMYVLISLGLILIIKIPKPKNVEKTKGEPNYNNYKKAKILTVREHKQYIMLKEITDNLDLIIFTKMRVADLITLKNNNTGDFNRIKSKHIDFIVCNQFLDVICCIEIDDSTHQRKDRIARDKFINKLFKHCKLPLLRVYDIEKDDVEKQIKKLM